MATVIDMPKLSDTMSVGTLVNWLKNEGDPIEPGDLIAEVETDKSTMELEAFDEGVLLKQVASVGDEVPIGGAVAVIGEKGEEVDMDALGATSGASTQEAPSDEKSDEDEADKKEAAKEETSDASKDKQSDSAESSEKPTVKTPTSKGGRIKASPLARKLADKEGIDLSSVKGTGPGGRIVKADVENAANNASGSTQTTTQSGPGSVPVTVSGTPITEEGKIPLNNMRTIIAQRLLESKTQVPHFYLETEVDVAPLMQLRVDLNNHLSDLPPEQGGIKLTITDFILKATAEALRRVPQVNSSWGGRPHSSTRECPHGGSRGGRRWPGSSGYQ